MKLRKLILFTVAAVICLSMVMASASTEGYVTDGLVGFFDGASNQGTKHDKASTTWKDLSGKGNDITVNLAEETKWTDTGFFVDSRKVFLPDTFVDLVNSDEFTVEIVLDNFTSKGTAWNPLMNCDNDSFSIFRRIDDDIVMFKNTTNDRPETPAGVALDYLSSRTTITITYEVGGKSTMYINGEYVDSKDALDAIDADNLFIGHDDFRRTYSVNYEGIRFYNKVLTAEQISKNYDADVKASNPTTGVASSIFYMVATLGFAGTVCNGMKKNSKED